MAPADRPLGRLALSQTVVDVMGDRRADAAWVATAWDDPRARILLLHEGRTLAADGALAPVAASEAETGDRYLLGVEEDGSPWFAVVTPGPLEGRQGRSVVGLRDVGATLSDHDAGLLVHAVALANWHATHPRCARCGEPTTVQLAGHQRHCPSCGADHFPRTDPAVIVLVTDASDRGLLGHNPRWPAARFSTLAGFVEPGESAEHAVAREVHEEAGLSVVDVEYLGSQPWPFPSSLMLGFTARALDPAALSVDGHEITEARWFSREDLLQAVLAGEVMLPSELSIARRLVEHWWGGDLPEGPTGW